MSQAKLEEEQMKGQNCPPLNEGVALAVGIDFSILRLKDSGIRFVDGDAITPDFRLDPKIKTDAVIAWHLIGEGAIGLLKQLCGKRIPFKVARGFDQAKTLLEPYWSWNRNPQKKPEQVLPTPTDQPSIADSRSREPKVGTVYELVDKLGDLRAHIGPESMRLMDLARHLKVRVVRESEIRLTIRRLRAKKGVKPLPPPPVEFFVPAKKVKRRKKKRNPAPLPSPDPQTEAQPSSTPDELKATDRSRLVSSMLTVDRALYSMAADLREVRGDGNGQLRLFSEAVVQINSALAPLKPYKPRRSYDHNKAIEIGVAFGPTFLTKQIVSIREFLDELRQEAADDGTRLPEIQSAVEDTAKVLGL